MPKEPGPLTQIVPCQGEAGEAQRRRLELEGRALAFAMPPALRVLRENNYCLAGLSPERAQSVLRFLSDRQIELGACAAT